MESNKKAAANIYLRKLFTLENDDHEKEIIKRIKDRWRASERMNAVLDNNKSMSFAEKITGWVGS